MTPEYSRRAGLMLQSIYWKVEPESDTEPGVEYLERSKEFRLVKAAVQDSDSYDDLSAEVKKLFDLAEKAQKDWEDFAQNDVGGFGRFHSTKI